MPNYLASDLDPVFRALADPTRRAVVAALASGPATVRDLSTPFPMALPSFLQHVRVLEDTGLIATQKTGRVRTCEMVPQGLGDAEAWLARQRSHWEARLDRFDAYVRRLAGEDDRP